MGGEHSGATAPDQVLERSASSLPDAEPPSWAMASVQFTVVPPWSFWRNVASRVRWTRTGLGQRIGQWPKDGRPGVMPCLIRASIDAKTRHKYSNVLCI
jgi:hypothetical protein